MTNQREASISFSKTLQLCHVVLCNNILDA